MNSYFSLKIILLDLSGLTCEHGLKVVTGRSHNDSVNWKSFIAIPRNQSDITQRLIRTEMIQPLGRGKTNQFMIHYFANTNLTLLYGKLFFFILGNILHSA